MKRLLGALLVCTSSLALAQGYTGQEREEHEQREHEQHERGQAGTSSEEQALFNPQQAFELRGTLEDSAPGEVTIARQGLPNVDLDVRGQTRFLLNGQQVQAGELPQGVPVLVRFNIDGDEPVAVVIEATSRQQRQQQPPGQQQRPGQPGQQP